jgi:hypothetical protein
MDVDGYSVAQGFVVGWGTLALLNAGLAQSKNRRGLTWFVLSLFLGPIATFILVALMTRLADPRDADEPAA